jgi:hypothetical protein
MRNVEKLMPGFYVVTVNDLLDAWLIPDDTAGLLAEPYALQCAYTLLSVTELL